MKKTAVFIAAGTGMGADSAKLLSSKGYKIAIMSSSGKGEELANKLKGLGYTGSNLKERDIDKKFVNFSFLENENQINLFFDKITFNLIGWQTIDIYQNVSITYLSSIKRNQKLKKNLFLLPQKK